MTIARLKTGKRGEALALSYVKRQGYKIIEKNYRTGRGEIDIIANDKNCIAFIEIRSGNTEKFGLLEDTIDIKKQNQIIKSALFYIKKYGLEERSCRFDVVCIKNVDSRFPKITLIKNAFELEHRYRY